jgi:hypothetical protein
MAPTERQYVRQRKDVKNLAEEVEKLTKKQQGFLKFITTSGDKFATIVSQAKLLSKALNESKKYSKKNNDLAKNQVKAAKIGVLLGKRQGPINKLKIAHKLRQLKLTRQQQDFEDDLTDSIIEQAEEQQKGAFNAEKMTEAAEAADDAFGNIGSTLKDFITNPLTGIIAILGAFSSMTDSIGDKFGAIGVTEFRKELGAANIEFTKLGLEGEEAFASISKMSNEFGIGFSESVKMASSVADIAKSTGMATEDAAGLLGMFTKLSGLSEEQAVSLAKSTVSLAHANNVAPDAVLAEIASSTESFAKFAGVGGENISRATVQAKKLGLTLDDVAGSAEGMLNFQDSLNKEIEASVLLGRNLNLQKARELALSGKLEEFQVELTKQVGTQAEFEAMNVVERNALAAALNMSLPALQKMVAAEKEEVTLAGELAKQDLSNLIPEESMSAIAETIGKLKAFGLELVEEYGPHLEEMFQNLVEPMVGMAKSAAEFLISLDESIGIGNALKGILAFLAIKSIITGIGAIYATFAQIPLGIGIPLGVAAVYGMLATINSIGDMDSPAKGKTRVSTKEGELFELSPNDDFVAAPGISDALNNGTGGYGNVNVGAQFDTSNIERGNAELKNEIGSLRAEMKSYFGFGGSMYTEAQGTNSTLRSARMGT